MADIDENIFPEEGFSEEEEQVREKKKDEDTLEDTDTPWLKFVEKYPQYINEPLPEGLTEAVGAGEDPTEAYLRIENERLNEKLKLLKIEALLKNSSAGSGKSTAAENPEDDFAAGLLYEG